MFSKLKFFTAITSTTQKLLWANEKSTNPCKSSSISFSTKNNEDPNQNYRNNLNIHRTFTANLRPDLKEESKKFNALFPDVKREIISYIEKRTNKKAADHFERALDYNVLGGKQFRVMQIILGYKDLVDKSQQTPEKMYQIYMACWALELVTSVMVIHDDMLDGALIRRGVPCWHTLSDVGRFAVNDYILLIHSGYFILKNHCKDMACYPRLFEAISDGVFSTHMGQTMDFVGMGNVTDFNLKTCRTAQIAIVADFLFYTPISMLMAISGYENREAIKHICDEMGHYHQCQNDLLDVFNIDGILHKTGHDIEIGKCSWLSTTCIEHSNNIQKQILIENYGRKDPECIERVKQLYLDMGMHDLYKEFAYGKYDSIKTLIAKADCDEPIKNVLYKILNLLFHCQSN